MKLGILNIDSLETLQIEWDKLKQEYNDVRNSEPYKSIWSKYLKKWYQKRVLFG